MINHPNRGRIPANIVAITHIGGDGYAVGNIDGAGTSVGLYHLPHGYTVEAECILDPSGNRCLVGRSVTGHLRLTSAAGEKVLTSDTYYRPKGATPARDAAALAAHEDRVRAVQREPDALWHREYLVETNSGTYSAAEAIRAIGVGDPAYADYRIFERVGDGRRRIEGCSPSRAPGYARRFSTELTAARRRLREIS